MKKRLIALCMAMCMIATIIFPNMGTAYPFAEIVTAAEDYDGYVYFTVEKSTIGQGLVVEPVKVGYYNSENLAAVTERALEGKTTYSGTVESSYYLEYVEDGGEPAGWTSSDIPKLIYDKLMDDDEIGKRAEETKLGEFDYSDWSGWMFALNNKGISAGAASYYPKDSEKGGTYTFDDGDIVRLQFTVYGYGQDINAFWDSHTLIDFPDKDSLIKAAADYEGTKADIQYKNAIDVIADWDATEDEIAAAYEGLTGHSATPSEPDEKDEPEKKKSVESEITMNNVSPTMTLADENGNPVDIGEPESRKYTFSVTPGKYILTAYGTDGETVNGTIGIIVTEDEKQSFNIFTQTINCSTADWAYERDYRIDDLKVREKSGAERENVTIGKRASNSDKITFLTLNGDSFSFNFTPVGDKEDKYFSAYKEGTIVSNNDIFITPSQKAGLKVTIPYADENADNINDYELEVGTLSTYYIYRYEEPVDDIVDRTLEKETISYEVSENTKYFYRVSNPYDTEVVTYGNYKNIKGVEEIEVTKDNLCVGTDYNKDTVIKDFSMNTYDVADIFLNANEKGCINLSPDDTYTLYPLRNWLAIEGISNAQVIEPDFHYTVLDENGNISDSVVAVTEDKSYTTSRHSATIEAKKPGTAIILVTYDAMVHDMGMGKTASADRKLYSAIWPENTGVIVVNVGAEAEFETGMTINKGQNNKLNEKTGKVVMTKLAGDYIDAECDVLYYTEDTGAEYTFTPEQGVKAQVSVPEVSGKSVAYHGFTDTGISYNADGSITLKGLMEGPNIVKLTYGNQTTYQVIRAKKLCYTVDNDSIRPGDSVTITFDRLYHPANKLSGYYNFMAAIRYDAPEGETKISGKAAQYNFASYENSQKLTFTIPEDYSGSEYTISNGVLTTTFYGSPIGDHRSVTYEKGKPANFTASMIPAVMGSLPDIRIEIKQPEENKNSDNYADISKDTLKYIKDTVTNPTVASVGGEWAVIGLARSGIIDEKWYNTYYKNVEEYVTKKGSAKLHNAKSTDNSRVILGLTAIGANPEKIAGYNLFEPLADMAYVTKQGINGAIFALIALDSKNYDIPKVTDNESEQTTREGLVEYILNHELENGGWSLKDEFDVDITAMAIQALAPYYNSSNSVKEAVDKALAVLSSNQKSDGSFMYRQGEEQKLESNAESIAQVVTALCAVGIHPDTDKRFVKDGNSALDALISFYDADTHSFRHTTQPDLMATEQAAYALSAYDRYLHDKNSLYDMRDAKVIYEVKEDVITPDTPKALNASNETKGIRLTWKKVDNVSGYEIYRSVGNGKKVLLTTIKNGNTTEYADTDVKAGSSYAYEIYSYNSSAKSKASNKSTIIRLVMTKVKAQSVNNGIKLTWNKVSGAKGYKVLRKAGNAKT